MHAATPCARHRPRTVTTSRRVLGCPAAASCDVRCDTKCMNSTGLLRRRALRPRTGPGRNARPTAAQAGPGPGPAARLLAAQLPPVLLLVPQLGLSPGIVTAAAAGRGDKVPKCSTKVAAATSPSRRVSLASLRWRCAQAAILELVPQCIFVGPGDGMGWGVDEGKGGAGCGAQRASLFPLKLLKPHPPCMADPGVWCGRAEGCTRTFPAWRQHCMSPDANVNYHSK